MEEALETLDWLGQPVRCRDCRHEAMHRDGRCRKGRACVRDRRAKRVERFFGEHSGLADDYLDHAYVEVRAIAVKYASPFRLPALLADSEPEVRAMAVLRLPADRVRPLAGDRDRRVRIAVASRVEGRALIGMLADEDYAVRLMAVRRLAPSLLPLAMNDPEPEVRRWVARRIVEDRPMEMRFDRDPLVRLELVKRLSPARLAAFTKDPGLRVRVTVAERVAPSDLQSFLGDKESVVREIATERLIQIARSDVEKKFADRRETCALGIAAGRCRCVTTRGMSGFQQWGDSPTRMFVSRQNTSPNQLVSGRGWSLSRWHAACYLLFERPRHGHIPRDRGQPIPGYPARTNGHECSRSFPGYRQ
jgi:hypothetical protein